MECRMCGACCIAISISSNIPGQGPKMAGTRCIHLVDNKCVLFNNPDRPLVCSTFKPSPDICGCDKEDAFRLITDMEKATQ